LPAEMRLAQIRAPMTDEQLAELTSAEKAMMAEWLNRLADRT
jgi:hypothetical protein